MDPTQTGPPQQLLDRHLFDIILSSSTLPVLILLIVFAWVLTNMLMSEKWRQGKRAREIRKAQEARRRRSQEQADEPPADAAPHPRA